MLTLNHRVPQKWRRLYQESQKSKACTNTATTTPSKKITPLKPENLVTQAKGAIEVQTSAEPQAGKSDSTSQNHSRAQKTTHYTKSHKWTYLATRSTNKRKCRQRNCRCNRSRCCSSKWLDLRNNCRRRSANPTRLTWRSEDRFYIHWSEKLTSYQIKSPQYFQTIKASKSSEISCAEFSRPKEKKISNLNKL